MILDFNGEGRICFGKIRKWGGRRPQDRAMSQETSSYQSPDCSIADLCCENRPPYVTVFSHPVRLPEKPSSNNSLPLVDIIVSESSGMVSHGIFHTTLFKLFNFMLAIFYLT